MKIWGVAALAAALAAGATAPATAQTLTVGLRSGTDTIDPHNSSLGNTVSALRNIYDPLVQRDETSGTAPWLALSWKPIGDDIWEFKLRPNVKFHDGSPFTAKDAKYSIERANLAGSPQNNLTLYTLGIKEVKAVDDLTVHIVTDGPVPLLPRNLQQIFMVPAKTGPDWKIEDFNSGKLAIGTGPFKFVSWVPKGDLVVQRNDDYWGKKSDWQRVVLKEMLNDSSRVAALLAGDIDLASNVPPTDTGSLTSNPAIAVFKTRSVYNFHLWPDMAREVSPMITDADGKPMTKNPLQDVRVRKALSLSINRQAIVERVMEGYGEPAAQMSPNGIWGISPNIKVDPYDPDEAKKLLTAAGYPNGFGVTLHCTSDRLPNDGKVCAALGGFFSRIGIKTTVAATPRAVYFPAWQKREYSLAMSGWGSLSGETSYILQSAVHTREGARGGSNSMYYSNAAVDKVIVEATRTLDDEKRKALLIQAMEMARADYNAIPVVTLEVIWAGRKDKVVYTARNDEETYLLNARRP